MATRQWYDDVLVLSLMRDAGEVYRDAIRQALEAVGCDDLPRHSALVLAGLDLRAAEAAFSSQATVVASLGLSKQTASQLIDTLVLREYLERRNDPVDRRRMEVRLTARGRTAATAIRSASGAVDATVAQLVTAEELHAMRAGLAAYRLILERATVRTSRPGLPGVSGPLAEGRTTSGG